MKVSVQLNGALMDWEVAPRYTFSSAEAEGYFGAKFGDAITVNVALRNFAWWRAC